MSEDSQNTSSEQQSSTDRSRSSTGGSMYNRVGSYSNNRRATTSSSKYTRTTRDALGNSILSINRESLKFFWANPINNVNLSKSNITDKQILQEITRKFSALVDIVSGGGVLSSNTGNTGLVEGDSFFEWDEENQAVKTIYPLYSDEWVSAGGIKLLDKAPFNIYTYSQYKNGLEEEPLPESEIDTFNAYTIKQLLNEKKMWADLITPYIETSEDVDPTIEPEENGDDLDSEQEEPSLIIEDPPIIKLIDISHIPNIPYSKLPKSIFGGMVYAGTINAHGRITLTNTARERLVEQDIEIGEGISYIDIDTTLPTSNSALNEALEGMYVIVHGVTVVNEELPNSYIIKDEFGVTINEPNNIIVSQRFRNNDWLVFNGNTISKIDNTDTQESWFEIQQVNGQYIIRSKYAFYSDSWISAGGLSNNVSSLPVILTADNLTDPSHGFWENTVYNAHAIDILKTQLLAEINSHASVEPGIGGLDATAMWAELRTINNPVNISKIIDNSHLTGNGIIKLFTNSQGGHEGTTCEIALGGFLTKTLAKEKLDIDWFEIEGSGANKVIKVNFPLYSTGWISSGGLNNNLPDLLADVNDEITTINERLVELANASNLNVSQLWEELGGSTTNKIISTSHIPTIANDKLAHSFFTINKDDILDNSDSQNLQNLSVNLGDTITANNVLNVLGILDTIRNINSWFAWDEDVLKIKVPAYSISWISSGGKNGVETDAIADLGDSIVILGNRITTIENLVYSGTSGGGSGSGSITPGAAYLKDLQDVFDNFSQHPFQEDRVLVLEANQERWTAKSINELTIDNISFHNRSGGTTEITYNNSTYEILNTSILGKVLYPSIPLGGLYQPVYLGIDENNTSNFALRECSSNFAFINEFYTGNSTTPIYFYKNNGRYETRECNFSAITSSNIGTYIGDYLVSRSYITLNTLTSALNNYVTTSDLNNYLTTSDLNGYINTVNSPLSKSGSTISLQYDVDKFTISNSKLTLKEIYLKSSDLNGYVNSADNPLVISNKNISFKYDSSVLSINSNNQLTLKLAYLKQHDAFSTRQITLGYYTTSTSTSPSKTATMTLNSSGDVVFNNKINASSITTSGIIDCQSVRASGELTAYYSSSRAFKDNVKTIEDGLSYINKLRPVEFDWNDLYKEVGGLREGHGYSFIAEEFKDVFKDSTRPIFEKYLSINIECVIPALVAAVKQLSNKCALLEDKLNGRNM